MVKTQYKPGQQRENLPVHVAQRSKGFWLQVWPNSGVHRRSLGIFLSWLCFPRCGEFILPPSWAPLHVLLAVAPCFNSRCRFTPLGLALTKVAGAKFKLQQVLFSQEQIQKQLEYLKELKKSGEEQRSQGDKNTANYLVRPSPCLGSPLQKEEGTKSEQASPRLCSGSQRSRANHIFRITCSWCGGREVMGVRG